MMKISGVEFAVLLLTAAVLAFTAGWFLRGAQSAGPVQIEVAHGTDGQVAQVGESTAPTAQATAGISGGKVNINTADSETLQTLPGIGEKRAADIIAYREAHGPFLRPSDLTRVDGIGSGMLEELLDLITVG